MKILYMITGLGGGGAERVVVDLADRMAMIGHTVKIAYLKGDIIVRPRSVDIDLVYLALETPFDIYNSFKIYVSLLKEFSPDVVHSHMVHANIFARISRNFIKISRLICSAHSKNEGGRLRMLAYKYTHHKADITTNVSYSASQNFERLSAVPKFGIITVYNGVDLEKFNQNKPKDSLKLSLGIDSHIPLFIAVGRFHDAKDYPNLIEAFFKFKQAHQLKVRMPKLLIVGDGELRSEIESKINLYGLNKDISLLGRRDDISALLNISDYFILSSKYEGLPTVVIEAMACHTFVVATDCGGSAEIMGDTGILVSPRNSEALAQALKQAVSKTPLEIQENNFKARQRVEELFSLEKSVQNWLKLYEQN